MLYCLPSRPKGRQPVCAMWLPSLEWLNKPRWAWNMHDDGVKICIKVLEWPATVCGFQSLIHSKPTATFFLCFSEWKRHPSFQRLSSGACKTVVQVDSRKLHVISVYRLSKTVLALLGHSDWLQLYQNWSSFIRPFGFRTDGLADCIGSNMVLPALAFGLTSFGKSVYMHKHLNIMKNTQKNEKNCTTYYRQHTSKYQTETIL